MAILEALLICPEGRSVEIYTDSQTALQAVNKALKLDRTRDWLKVNNLSLLKAIRRAVKSKDLKLQIHKVKAHTRIEGNEKTDREAKRCIRESHTMVIKLTQVEGIVYKI